MGLQRHDTLQQKRICTNGRHLPVIKEAAPAVSFGQAMFLGGDEFFINCVMPGAKVCGGIVKGSELLEQDGSRRLG
jgi:hypothetical protein